MKIYYRLRKNKDFTSLLKKGKTLDGEQFLVRYQKNILGHIRVGLITSKKVGNAVKRNLIRRQLRAMLETVATSSSFDLVIKAKINYHPEDYLKNQLELSNLITRIINE